jgi:uncharacterized protein YbjQ (UPF0145 family)
MLIVTTPDVSGRVIEESLGQVFGVVVRSRGLGGNLVAGLRSIVGGEIVEYTQMLEEARRHAVDRLTENAQIMGADAVVAMRFDSSEIGDTMSEIVAYGTAVRLIPAGARAPAPQRAEIEAPAPPQVGHGYPPAATDADLPGQPAPTFGHRLRAP